MLTDIFSTTERLYKHKNKFFRFLPLRMHKGLNKKYVIFQKHTIISIFPTDSSDMF